MTITTRDTLPFNYRYNQGTQSLKSGNPSKAIKLFKSALKLQPNSKITHNNLAIAYNLINSDKLAQKHFQQALNLDPHYHDALSNLANLLIKNGQYHQAISTLKQIPVHNNFSTQTNLLLGVCYSATHRPKLALAHLKSVLAQEPHSLEALKLTTNLLLEQNKPDQVITLLQSLLANSPNTFFAHINIGVAYQKLNQFDQALHHFHQAKNINPRHPIPYNNLSNIYRHQRDYHSAINLLQQAISFDPHYADAYFNLGCCYESLNLPHQAIANFRLAHRLAKDSDSLLRLGEIHFHQNKITPALAYYQKALLLDPCHQHALFGLAKSYLYTNDYDKLPSALNQLAQATAKSLKSGLLPAETPFFHLLHSTDQAQNQQIAIIHSQQLTHPSKPNPPLTAKKTLRKIGYISNGFTDFPTGHNLISILENHHKSLTIHQLAYDLIKDSTYYHRFQKACPQISLDNLSTPATNKLIASQHYDLLIDLKGHTHNSRLELFAPKLAPVQISWLGYPATTGSDFIDYIIADPIVLPPNNFSYFTETPLLLPHTYRPTDNTITITPPQKQSAPFTFSVFNLSYKLTEQFTKLIAQLLTSAPNSQLMLYPTNKQSKSNLRKFFKSQKISPSRIIFTKKIPKIAHLKRISRTQLALDPFPINGHTTTVDTLMAKVPVITLLGYTFISRVSASTLLALGVSELITHSPADFLKLAKLLSQNPHKLQRITQKIIRNYSLYPLFDSARFTRNLELAYHHAFYQPTKSKRKPRFIKDPNPLINDSL